MAALARIESKVDALTKAKAAAPAQAASTGAVADAYDLDSQYGDEEIKKMPSQKYWQGDDFSGHRMTETSPEFLDAFARYKDACAYMTEKSGDQAKAKYVGYDRKSAARARGWAQRMRDGKVQRVERSAPVDSGEDQIPF